MFGLGATELVVILVLALILLGPKRLPDVASGLGKAIRQFRKATRDLTEQLDIDDEVKAPFRELKAALRDEPAPYVAPIATAAPLATATPAADNAPRPGPTTSPPMTATAPAGQISAVPVVPSPASTAVAAEPSAPVAQTPVSDTTKAS